MADSGMIQARTVELVVHCWAEKIPQFAAMLTAQLSSLAIWRPHCGVMFTLFSAPGDHETFEVASQFKKRWDREVKPPRIRWWPLNREHLFRRAIGRNEAAKVTQADVVWFCDVDYLFGDGCLDTLAEAKFEGLVHPRQAQIHRSHALGDAEIAKIVPGEVFRPDLSIFEPWKPPYAIGGLQIVPGDLARQGYLDGTKWSAPVPDAKDFLNTKEDRHYRGACGGSKPINLPNLFRWRHSPSAFEPAEDRLAQTAGKS